MKYPRSLLLLALALLAFAPARAQGPGPTPPVDERLERILARAGEAVARYQAGLFSITFTETLRDEELNKEMTPKKSREFVFETVVLREALSENEEDFDPKSLRRLKIVDGKPAKKGRRAPWYGYNVQSLGLLLPQYRKLYEFTLEGEERFEGRPAYRIRMLRAGEGEPRVEWHGGLGGKSFTVFLPTVFTIRVDAETYDVMRVESHLAAPFEFESPRAFGPVGPSRRLRYAVQDYVADFRRQQFKDPEQTLLVPVAAEWTNVVEGASKPRTHSTLRFSNYQRFRSDVKVIEEPDN